MMNVACAVTNKCFVFVAGVLKEGQQWEVYIERSAGGPDAESPQVPSTASGRELLLHSALLLSYYIFITAFLV